MDLIYLHETDTKYLYESSRISLELSRPYYSHSYTEGYRTNKQTRNQVDMVPIRLYSV